MEKFSWAEIAIIVTIIGGLIGILTKVMAFLFKKWMADREKQEADIRSELVTTTAKIAHDLADRHDKAVADIKDTVTGNRIFYEKTYNDLSGQIREMDCRLVGRMDVANGRTAKLESRNNELKVAVEKVTTTCEERSKVFYKEAAKNSKKKSR